MDVIQGLIESKSGLRIVNTNGTFGVAATTTTPTLPTEIAASSGGSPSAIPAEISVVGTTAGTIGTTERFISFPYSGTAATKDYTFTTTENLVCDILVVGGGGGGGDGGGGGGGYVYMTNINIPVAGSYNISVGKGGNGGGAYTAGSQGASSTFIVGGTTYTAYGGGGGAGTGATAPAHTAGQVGSYGGNGADRTVAQTYTSTQGNRGGTAIAGSYGSAGGGGGAGGVGSDANFASAGVIAGSGIQYYRGGTGGNGALNTITGVDTYYAGGGTGGANTNQGTDATTQNAPVGGGGIGSRAPAGVGGNGIDGTGGGGGGGDPERAGTTGNGGSGIVIIRYRKPSSEIVVSSTIAGTTDRYISFPYSGTAATKDYTITTTEALSCDILVVGGGGGGGALIGSGGGGGGLLYYTGLTITTNTYTISVGNGGIGAVNYLARGANGSNSSVFGYIAYGGGGGSGQSWVYNQTGTASGTLQTTSANQGSGAGGTRYKTLGNAGTAGQGYSGGDAGYYLTGGGGGGAGGVGGNSSSTSGGRGGIGIYNSITNISIGYAGGGAGNGQEGATIFGALATEGGGNSGPINGSGGYSKGSNGSPNTGGGGGGGDFGGGGNGGSGIIIIRYRKATNTVSNTLFSILNGGVISTSSNLYSNLITNYIDTPVPVSTGISSQWSSNVSKIYYNTSNVGIGTIDPVAPLHIYNTTNTRLLLDTTTNSVASLEFRRGTGADMQNDYRFINDTDTYIKLQIENSTQSYGNTSANLAWFSSNETIIHKNTTINGRVGIGTVYHTTRSLDVLGDANVSGSVSVGGLSVSSSGSSGVNAIITNSLTSNTSLIIRNEMIPQTSTSSSIEFIRGTAADANRDYKLGNYNSEFKVISSTSSVDTDYIKITTAGAITNPTGTASWNTGSDRRIKENIERASYDKCFDNINKLELNRFNYIDGFNTVSRDSKQLGFIAQEVYDIFPKAISSHEYYTDTLSIPDLLSIDVSQINYALYGAVKKLIEINEEDQKNLSSYDNRIKTIKTILNIAMELTTSNILDTSNLLDSTSNVIIDTSNLLDTTSNVIIDTSNLLDSTSNVIIDTSNLLDTTSNLLDTSIFLDTTSNIIIDT
jgi:hypothetical protein